MANTVNPEVSMWSKLLEMGTQQPTYFQPLQVNKTGNSIIDAFIAGQNLQQARKNIPLTKEINDNIRQQRGWVWGMKPFQNGNGENPQVVITTPQQQNANYQLASDNVNNGFQQLFGDGANPFVSSADNKEPSLAENNPYGSVKIQDNGLVPQQRQEGTAVQDALAMYLKSKAQQGVPFIQQDPQAQNAQGQMPYAPVPYEQTPTDNLQNINPQVQITQDQYNPYNVNPQVQNSNVQMPQIAQNVQQAQPQVQDNSLQGMLARALSTDNPYRMENYVKNQSSQGMPALIAAGMYNIFGKQAREQELMDVARKAIGIWNDPNATSNDKTQASAALATILNQPDLVYDLQQKRRDDDLKERQFMATQGYMLNPDYDENISNSIGNNIVSTALNNYKEGEQWMSPNGTGTSRTQCSNWVSDVLERAGVKGLSSPDGNELMKQAGNSYRKGLMGIQPGDVLNFKDHVGFYIGNGQYMARNSSGGVHRGSMEEAIQAFGEPLGYISMSHYTGNRRGQKYINNPNYVSDREKLDRQLANDRWREAMANAREERAQARSDREFALKLAEFEAKYGKGAKGRRGRGSGGSGGGSKEMSYAEALAAEKRMANGLTKETPDMSDEDKDKIITDKDIENIGRAWSSTADKYLEEKGDDPNSIEKAMEQFYYDKNKDPKNNPTTMNAEKLATSIASATAEALDIPVNERYQFIKNATDYLLKYDEELRYKNNEREKKTTAWDKYLSEKQGARSDNRRVQEENLAQRKNQEYNRVFNEEIKNSKKLNPNSISRYIGTTAYLNKDEIDAVRDAQKKAKEAADKIK